MISTPMATGGPSLIKTLHVSVRGVFRSRLDRSRLRLEPFRDRADFRIIVRGERRPEFGGSGEVGVGVGVGAEGGVRIDAG